MTQPAAPTLQEPTEAGRESIKRWFTAHTELSITTVVFAAVVVRIIAVSHGHVTTAQALVRHGPVTVLVGTLFAFVPYVLILFTGFAFFKWLRGYVGRDSEKYRVSFSWLIAALWAYIVLDRLEPSIAGLGWVVGIPLVAMAVDFIQAVRKGQSFDLWAARHQLRYTAAPYA